MERNGFFLEFTFREVDLPRVNSWLALCAEASRSAKRPEHRELASELEGLLLALDFESGDKYSARKNRGCISARYDIREFDSSRADDVLSYVGSLLGENGLSECGRKAACLLYEFLEHSLWDGVMGAADSLGLEPGWSEEMLFSRRSRTGKEIALGTVESPDPRVSPVQEEEEEEEFSLDGLVF